MLHHPWDVSPKEAMAIQEELRGKVISEDRLGEVRRVIGVDVAFPRADVARAAGVVLQLDNLQVLDQAVVERPCTFPYVPGLLSFREVPVIIDALAALSTCAEVVLCDGQGLAHPRRFGLACHLGVLTAMPTIGVAKTRLHGDHRPVGVERGSWQPLMAAGETIGAVLRTRARVKPVYVSAGHLLSLETALDLVLRCSPRFRLPETTRLAHRLASET
jgi:deoxyribonuclease V